MIGGFPAPGARAIAALHHALLVDLGNDFAVAGEQRLGRAHLGAERQLSFGKTVRTIFLVFLLAPIRFGTASAVGALVHFSARAEISDLRVLRRSERTGVEAIAATDAQILGVKHDTVIRRVDAIHRAHRRAWGV